MFKIKAYHVHPINMVCLTLLVSIIVILLMSNKPIGATPQHRVRHIEQIVRDEVSNNHDYSIELVTDNSNPSGLDAILYDGDR